VTPTEVMNHTRDRVRKCGVYPSPKRQRGVCQPRSRRAGTRGSDRSCTLAQRRSVGSNITTPNRVTPAGPRPLRLSPRAIEVAVTALVPEGPPIAFRFSGTQHTVVSSIGPERIETGWWRGPHLQRDYYRVATQSGRHAWLFRRRDTNQWFLHGWFD